MYDTFVCIKCGYEVLDNEGECGINGIHEEAGQTFAEERCPECNGKLLLDKE